MFDSRCGRLISVYNYLMVNNSIGKIIVPTSKKKHKLIDNDSVYCRTVGDMAYVSYGNRAYPTCSLCGKNVKS
jgi:hypothetical protein